MVRIIPNKTIPLETIFKDASLIAVNKPAWIPVYPLKENEKETIANALVADYPEQDDTGPPLQAGIVHRLDNDTSGILIVARNNDVYDKLRSIWNTDQVKKEYTALVFGITPEKETISIPIAHHPSKKKKMMVCETKTKEKKYKGRPARTEIKRVQIFRSNRMCEGNRPVVPTREEFSLLKVQITTGVRHQIRVHLASIGHPIVGDKLYGNFETRNSCLVGRQAKLLPDRQAGEIIKRQFLHLGKIELPHPVTEKILKVESPLPSDLQEILLTLS